MSPPKRARAKHKQGLRTAPKRTLVQSRPEIFQRDAPPQGAPSHSHVPRTVHSKLSAHGLGTFQPPIPLVPGWFPLECRGHANDRLHHSIDVEPNMQPASAPLLWEQPPVDLEFPS